MLRWAWTPGPARVILRAPPTPARLLPTDLRASLYQLLADDDLAVVEQGCELLLSLSGPRSWGEERLLSRLGRGARLSADGGAPMAGPELQQLVLAPYRKLVCGAVLRALGALDRAEQLSLRGCDTVRRVGFLGGLEDLRELDLRRCEALSDLSGIHGLTALRALRMDWNPALRSAALQRLLTETPALEVLTVGWCGGLTALALPPTLPELQTLNVGGCTALEAIGLPAETGRLQRLYASGCGALAQLGPLPASLEALYLDSCSALEAVAWRSTPNALQVLDVHYSNNIAWPSDTPLPALRRLHTSSTDTLRRVSMPALETLEFSGFRDQNDDMQVIAGFPTLSTLHLRLDRFFSDRDVLDLTPLRALPKLRTLKLTGGRGYRRITGLPKLSTLQTLHLEQFADLSLQALSLPEGLRALSLRDCERLSDLHALSGLEQLFIEDCVPLSDTALRSAEAVQAFLSRLP